MNVVKLATLRWSNTEDVYMNLGCYKGLFSDIFCLEKLVGLFSLPWLKVYNFSSKTMFRRIYSICSHLIKNICIISGQGLICCGDDKGTIWMYNLPQYGCDEATPMRKIVKPSGLLVWPELQVINFAVFGMTF